MPTFCQKLSPKDEKMSPKVLTSFQLHGNLVAKSQILSNKSI